LSDTFTPKYFAIAVAENYSDVMPKTVSINHNVSPNLYTVVKILTSLIIHQIRNDIFIKYLFFTPQFDELAHNTMTLALFDLDNTLLSGDSDYEWGAFLVSKKLVDAESYEKANQKFYADYKAGSLDIYEFSAFSFEPLSRLSMQELNSLHQEFMDEIIRPLITDKARGLVNKHGEQGHTLAIITATNSFITTPIAKELGIVNLLATEPKIVNGRYTTQIDGIHCFKEGKVERLAIWLKENQETLKGSFFYSDSHNDLPLMEKVTTAIAVDPDDTLRKIALERGWKTITLRDQL